MQSIDEFYGASNLVTINPMINVTSVISQQVTADSLQGNVLDTSGNVVVDVSNPVTVFKGDLDGNAVTVISISSHNLSELVASSSSRHFSDTYKDALDDASVDSIPGTLVLRDGSGSIVGDLVGNAYTASTADTVTDISGHLLEELEETANSNHFTNVYKGLLDGVTSDSNTNNLVYRDENGNFGGNVINAASFVGILTGSASAVDSLTGHYLSGLSDDANSRHFADGYKNMLDDATVDAIPDTLVLRDGSGNIVVDYASSAGTVDSISNHGLSDLSDGAGYKALLDGATDASTASTLVVRSADGSFSGNNITANQFTGSLAGSSTSVESLSGHNLYELTDDSTSRHFTDGYKNLLDDATTDSIPGTIVIRDGSGAIVGDIFATYATSAGSATNADHATTSGEADTVTSISNHYLSDLSEDSNSVHFTSAFKTLLENATSSSTPFALVLRDEFGNFNGDLVGTVSDISNHYLSELMEDVSSYHFGSEYRDLLDQATTDASGGTLVLRDEFGNFNGDLVGTVSDISNHYLSELMEDVSSYHFGSEYRDLLDQATADASGNTLVLRDENGDTSIGTLNAIHVHTSTLGSQIIASWGPLTEEFSSANNVKFTSLATMIAIVKNTSSIPIDIRGFNNSSTIVDALGAQRTGIYMRIDSMDYTTTSTESSVLYKKVADFANVLM